MMRIFRVLVITCPLVGLFAAAAFGDEAQDSVADSVTASPGAVTHGDSAQSGDRDEFGDGFTVITLSIEHLEANTGSLSDTIDITIETGGQRIAGFDLRFGCSSPVIDIVEVLPGEVYDSCQWEFYNAKTAGNAGKEGFPFTLWHAIALAEAVPDQKRPVCFGFERRASLLQLVVQSQPGKLIDDTTIAIFFLWEDCGDNTIADASGEQLLMSSQVTDYVVDEALHPRAGFPTRRGAPRECTAPDIQNPPVRAVKFENGGIEFRLDLEGVERRERTRQALEQWLADDQNLRRGLDSLNNAFGWDSPEVQDAWARQHELDSTNQARLDSLVAEGGWPKLSEVGDRAAAAAFLIVQHAPLEYMQKHLPAIKRAFNLGEFHGSDMALLEDRMLMYQGLPQIYGSQMTIDRETGEPALYDLADPAKVDSLRASRGLGPLADYLLRFGIEGWTPQMDSSAADSL